MHADTTGGQGFAIWSLVATFIFLFLNAFFVAAEFALVKVRPSRMRNLAAKGNHRAAVVSAMLERLDLYLSACQLGITLSSLILGWLAEPAVASLLIKLAAALGVDLATATWLHPASLAIALAVITLLHMTVGEQAPKMWSIQKAESAALAIVLPLRLFSIVFRPMISLVNTISNGLARLFGVSPGAGHKASYDLAELRSILNAAAQAGQLTPRQKLFSDNILSLAKLEVRHIMVPRTQITCLSTTHSREENLKIIQEAGHSRFPWGDPDLDNVRGLILARDILGQLLEGKTADLNAALRPCPTVTDTQPLSRFIMDLQRLQTHCAVVTDEHGTTIGLAFLEDALEEIVGPIRDEFDQQESRILQVSPDVIELSGSVSVPEAEVALGLDLDDEADTIGGLVIAQSGRVPTKGDELKIGPYTATVTETVKTRVTRIRFDKSKVDSDQPND
ncbi:MAG: HlyC/CorC family transporter [Deltaproteobacteria bacterium]|nr:HlyC/CorC family transporter [Deltaproteobacteria bacterium]